MGDGRMSSKTLSLEEILERTIWMWPEDAQPIIKYLGMENVQLPAKPQSASAKHVAHEMARYLCEMGSNDVARFLRGGQSVSYDEVVLDVGKKLKAEVSKEASSAANEQAILSKVFADTVKNMTEEERRALLRTMNLQEQYVAGAGPLAVGLLQALASQYGGFAVYRLSVVAANVVSRALLGSGLSLATNAAITRGVGALLGPVGWIATGAWLAIDLAGPAFRKTVPAVVHIAFLRQMLMKRVTIGIVGDGSAGKDSMLKSVFGIDSGQIDPVAGSTTQAMVYVVDPAGAVQLINYPGFNDFRAEVNRNTDALLGHTDLFALVVDISRGVTDNDVQIYKKVSALGRPILLCANKVDLARKREDRSKLIQAVRTRLQATSLVETSFDPDPRLHLKPEGIAAVRSWITDQLQQQRKETAHVWVAASHH